MRIVFGAHHLVPQVLIVRLAFFDVAAAAAGVAGAADVAAIDGMIRLGLFV